MQRFVLILLTLVLLGPLGIDIYLPLIPAIAVALNSPESLIQSTVALFILIMGLGQLLAGPLVDKYGRRPMALAGVIIYLIGAIMAALATSATLFVLSRLFQGLAVCCTAVAIFSSVRDKLNGDDAARTYGFLNGTLNIVPALAPLLVDCWPKPSAGEPPSGSSRATVFWYWHSSSASCLKRARTQRCPYTACRCANTHACYPIASFWDSPQSTRVPWGWH